MRSDVPLDYALFQLSPKCSRCELVVSSGRNTEKLASGLVKPFATHLKVIEEQAGMSVHSIKLEVEWRNNPEMWFTKGTLERFVRFVSTPEILELANTFDAEVSQLESARRIYSQGTGDQLSGAGGAGSGATAAADATKKELLRAIDVRLVAAQQDLSTACTRAASAGFNPDTVMDLQMFADRFGAQRLNEACRKFISLCERRPDLILTWKAGGDDWAVRSSYGSDMSIDEEPTTPENRQPTGSHQPLRYEQQHSVARGGQEQQLRPPFTVQEPKPSFSLLRSRESSVEPEEISKNNDSGVEKEKKQEAGVGDPPSADQDQSIQGSQPSRRLSVQDRVKLFENKQKESSGNSGSGGKPVVGKSIEFRRLSSDLSASASAAAAEKAVLRRWSGASDMSIDLSAEKKDIGSPLCTPSSSSVSNSKPEDLKDTASLSKPEPRIVPGRVDNIAASVREEVAVGKLTTSSDKSEEAFEGGKLNSSSAAFDSDALKDQTCGKSQIKSFLYRAEDNSLNNQANSEKKFRSLSSSILEDADGLETQLKFKGSEKRDELAKIKGLVASGVQVAGLQEKVASQLHLGHFTGKGSDTRSAVSLHLPDQVDFSSQKVEVGSRDKFISESHLRVPQRSVLEGGSGSRIRESFTVNYKGTEGDISSLKSRAESSVGMKDIEKKELASADKLSGGTAVKSENSGPQKMKFEKQVTAPKNQGQRDDIPPVSGSYKTLLSGKGVTNTQDDFGSFTMPPPEHAQRIRQSKGNQELNDELKMKANELEKLFAEHKLRVPGDQSNPTWRSRPVDRKSEPPANSSYKNPSADAHLDDDSPLNVPDGVGSSKNMAKLNDASVAKPNIGHNYVDVSDKNSSELNSANGSRGKFYQSYVQKRDAKLREEWSSKREEKEAKLKEMQDSLEQSRAEMKARFSGSADRQDSQFNIRRRAERLRSFNTRSIMRREQQQLDFGQSDDEEDGSEFPEQKYYGEDGPLNEASFMDGLSRSVQGKKTLRSKSLTSSTPRTSAAPVKSASRAINNSGRRKVQSENPLAQSVPNFSDLRKENAKPSSAASKITRSQARNYNRNKSTGEDPPFIKEEKSRRSQSLRKSTGNPIESKEISSLNSEVISMTMFKFDKDDSEQSSYDKHSKTLDSKPFRKRGSSVDFGARAFNITNNECEHDDLVFEAEDSVVPVKDEEQEFETLATKSCGEPEVDQESEKLNFGSENVVGRSFAGIDSSLVAELPAIVPSGLHRTENVHDSPGESPVSWNSRSHHPFSYSHEMSDIDASVDSPIGSPASWNSHSLSQTETDAARMRKKWGAAQKPILVGNSSHNQSRKDMTRGFKRLLKFGRKSRGTESLVDWISATTSEGDDDTEDGRDLANRSSEDLRKSRMGSSQGHPSDDSFNETEFFSEQVQSLRSSIPAPPANFKLREDHLSGSSIKAPRSFFSLSSFRSKGSESKPR